MRRVVIFKMLSALPWRSLETAGIDAETIAQAV